MNNREGESLEEIHENAKGRVTMHIYLSGPMSHRKDTDWNYPAFNTAATRLRGMGHVVFNPAENFNGRTDLSREEYMREDVRQLVDLATMTKPAVVVLDGWQNSKGAKLEVAVARELGIPVLRADTLNPVADEERVVDAKTGGMKAQKLERFDLIPAGPLMQLARVYGMGAKKYDDNNWRKGYRWSLTFGACQRHLWAFWNGEEMDPESGLPHLAHAMWHCATMLEFMESYRDGDDRFVAQPRMPEVREPVGPEGQS